MAARKPKTEQQARQILADQKRQLADRLRAQERAAQQRSRERTAEKLAAAREAGKRREQVQKIVERERSRESARRERAQEVTRQKKLEFEAQKRFDFNLNQTKRTSEVLKKEYLKPERAENLESPMSRKARFSNIKDAKAYIREYEKEFKKTPLKMKSARITFRPAGEEMASVRQQIEGKNGKQKIVRVKQPVMYGDRFDVDIEIGIDYDDQTEMEFDEG